MSRILITPRSLSSGGHPALAALEEFLAYVDTQRAAGRVVYATVGEIAERAFPEQ